MSKSNLSWGYLHGLLDKVQYNMGNGEVVSPYINIEVERLVEELINRRMDAHDLANKEDF